MSLVAVLVLFFVLSQLLLDDNANGISCCVSKKLSYYVHLCAGDKAFYCQRGGAHGIVTTLRKRSYKSDFRSLSLVADGDSSK